MSEDSDDTEVPIDSFEKFLRCQKLGEWPETNRKYVDMPIEYPYSSAEEIQEFLKTKLPFPVEIATSISSLVDEVWGKVKKHDAILSKAIKSTGRPKGDASKTKHNHYPDLIANARKKIKEKVEAVPLCPDIMDFEFPGFSNLDYTEIPGLPNISQHLDRISEAQAFNSGFLKIWKPFFLSEHSIIVFKDTFWWFFLHSFKPSLEDESALFDSIATGFVALLLMLHNDVKDKLFKVYADCLAQAVYAAFYGAFPQSKERFDDDFKTVLVEVISLWVSGIKPKLLSWKNWNLNWLTPAKDAVKTKKNSICDFQTDLTERIASAMRSGVAQSQTPTASRSLVDTGSYRRRQESHYIGPGPQFDHIYFKPWGQSPLVGRYLQLQGIASTAGSSTRKVKRTEIATVPPERPTYQEVINETQGKISKWRGMYNQCSQQTNKAISVLHKRRHVQLLELNRIQKQLMNSRTETKIYSEAIMNKWDHATDGTSHRQRLEPCVSQRSDSDDSRNAEESPKAPEQPGEQA